MGLGTYQHRLRHPPPLTPFSIRVERPQTCSPGLPCQPALCAAMRPHLNSYTTAHSFSRHACPLLCSCPALPHGSTSILVYALFLTKALPLSTGASRIPKLACAFGTRGLHFRPNLPSSPGRSSSEASW